MRESKNRLVMTILSVNKVLKGVKADVDQITADALKAFEAIQTPKARPLESSIKAYPEVYATLKERQNDAKRIPLVIFRRN
jgi:hypothetical protein